MEWFGSLRERCFGPGGASLADQRYAQSGRSVTALRHVAPVHARRLLSYRRTAMTTTLESPSTPIAVFDPDDSTTAEMLPAGTAPRAPADSRRHSGLCV